MKHLVCYLSALLFVFAAANASLVTFDRGDVIQALAEYGVSVNGLAQYSPASCANYVVPDASALATAITALVNDNFASNVQYFQTSDGLDFTVGGTYTLSVPPIPITSSRVLREVVLPKFYTLIFSGIFTSTNSWIYSTPSVTFNARDPDFNNQPTALVIVENVNDAFTCSAGPNNTLVEVRQVYKDTFYHTFCLDGVTTLTWKICGFYEDNKAVFTESNSLYTHVEPTGS